MQYKTIVLELLEQRPQLRDQLQRHRLMLAMVNHIAGELKTRHEAIKSSLRQRSPASAPIQIASAALEIALSELESRLPTASLPEDGEALSLEAAMAYLLRPSPPG